MKNEIKSSALNLRQKAEEMIKNSIPSKSVSVLSEADTLKLMHELEVFQIELELQQEELMWADELEKAQVEKMTARKGEQSLLEKIHLVQLKQAEKALSVSEIRYRRLFESSKDGILILDAGTGKITDVNPFLIELLGYSQEQFIEKEIWEIGFLKDITANREKFLELQQKQYVRYDDLPLQTADGRKINVEFVSNVYFSNKTKVIQCNIRDITARKIAEESLRDIHWRMESIIEATHLGTWEWNIQTGELVINEEWAHIIGYTRAELAPISMMTWEALAHPDDMKQSAKLLKLHRDGALPYYDCECRKMHKGGYWVWVRDRGRIITRTSNGHPLMMFGTQSDISSQKLVEEELKFKNVELQKSNTAKDKFFSIIAHDLRSPFNGFLGLTRIMAEDLTGMTRDEIQKKAVIMRKSAFNLYSLLENLLDWSRLQRNLTTFAPGTLLLLPKISESIALVNDQANKKEISVVSVISEDLKVFADANMFGTIIRNLLSNAVKFTPKGGSVIISAKSVSDNSVEISIKDSGIGMTRQMIGDIFRLDVNTSRKGTSGECSTGLGLIICKDFIEKHGGRLWVESEENKGSIFYFTFPAMSPGDQ